MKQIEEKPRMIPVLAETDVLVVGGGPGGLAAALAAARTGVETILVERYGCFGGNITQAMVQTIAWYRHEHTVDAGGIGVEFERRAKEIGASQVDLKSLGRVPEVGEDIPEWVGQMLVTDMFKYVADQMVEEAAITPLLHCLALDAIMDGNTIRGVVTESKSGRQAILAKRVIDASGDADIAFHAGVPYRKDPKEQLMGVSVSFGCSGVDVEIVLEYLRGHDGRIGDWAVETTEDTKELFDTRIGDAFTRAAEAGEIPEGKLWGGGPWVHGLTEAGEATFINTEREIKNQARFEDSIGVFPEFLDGYGVVYIPATGRYFQVPYGILVPELHGNRAGGRSGRRPVNQREIDVPAGRHIRRSENPRKAGRQDQVAVRTARPDHVRRAVPFFTR